MAQRQRNVRNQINFTVDDEVQAAIEEIRSMRRPIPTVSDAIRQAILNERDSLRKKVGALATRGGA